MQRHRLRGRNYRPSDIVLDIVKGENFVAGNMRGLEALRTDKGHAHDNVFTGQLPDEWRERFIYDGPDYVVWSYDTPIAWHVPGTYRDIPHWNEYRQKMETPTYIPDHWVWPKERYSITTDRHSGFVRDAMEFMPRVIRTLDQRAED